jgi:exopolyphosphatase/guanosine-5'-triphosphate,3'-diphosphate pyrophosphatase
LPDLRLAVKANSAELAFPRGWLDEHPLTAIDLEQEAGYLAAAGFKLRVV